MSQSLKMRAVGKIDVNKNEYYFTRPDLPCLVDLSKVVIFIHPWEEDGKFGADIIIKEYQHNSRRSRSVDATAATDAD